MSSALLALIDNRLRQARHANYVVRAAAGLQPTISIRWWKVFDGGRSDKVSCLKLILRLAAFLAQGTSSATSQQAPCFVRANKQLARYSVHG